MQVKISGKGVIQGVTVFNPTGIPKCHRFSSVPFALPPTENRRWLKPEPLPPSYLYGTELQPGIFTKPCSPCPQLPDFGDQPSSSEDCLQCNIYVPIEKPPKGGWPVLFWIHGGFLQFGSCNSDDPSDLISKTGVKCIVVSPGYRLGIFGFIASTEISTGIVANVGFWDQRLALEWTYDNIESFGGNKSNIIVGGLSAGAYSAFHQLAHDISHKSSRQIIRRVLQFSNGCGVQPKSLSEADEHLENVMKTLGIPREINSYQKLQILRRKSTKELIEAVTRMQRKFFRPVMDDEFISKDLFQRIYDGRFGQRMCELNIQTIIGDLTQEYHLYSRAYPPKSYEGLVERLSWDYPQYIATAICEPYKQVSHNYLASQWAQLFGKLYADMQIHSTMRGFITEISQHVPLSHILRYRIDWRTKSVDKRLPREVGATHGTDMSIWFYGNGDTLTPEEQKVAHEWLKPLSSFIKGEKVQWGTRTISQVRYLTASGETQIKDDEAWDDKKLLWDLTKRATIGNSSTQVPSKL
ncbi:carboxylesterase-like protein [Tricladium varicosporioides]|nr:carboxylesterase-like protein [Hymenoscyphus varicosporioides]